MLHSHKRNNQHLHKSEAQMEVISRSCHSSSQMSVLHKPRNSIWTKLRRHERKNHVVVLAGVQVHRHKQLFPSVTYKLESTTDCAESKGAKENTKGKKQQRDKRAEVFFKTETKQGTQGSHNHRVPLSTGVLDLGANITLPNNFALVYWLREGHKTLH